MRPGDVRKLHVCSAAPNLDDVCVMLATRPNRSTSEGWRHNLPHPVSSFIGHEREVAEGTVANHVKSILARHGFDSRVQIAAWAVEHGLFQRSPA